MTTGIYQLFGLRLQRSNHYLHGLSGGHTLVPNKLVGPTTRMVF